MGFANSFYRNWVNSKKGMVIATVLITGAALYPAVVRPYMYAEEYRKIQEVTRRGIDRERIQPGGMRVWTDPFKEQQKEESQYIQKLREERSKEE